MLPAPVARASCVDKELTAPALAVALAAEEVALVEAALAELSAFAALEIALVLDVFAELALEAAALALLADATALAWAAIDAWMA
jgi:hypothetical protein